MTTRNVLLIGGALPPELVEAHPRVSAAAAKWQMSLAHALASEWNAQVSCLSYLPVESYAIHEEARHEGNVTIIPIERPFKRGSLAIYCARMVRALALAPKSDRVICYNPLLWTAPFARLVAKAHGAKSLVVLADFSPADDVPFNKRLNVEIEKRLLRSFKHVLLLSQAGAELLRESQRYEVFNGVADEWAMAQPPVVFDGPPRFVYSGAINSGAGVDVFVDAARIAHAQGCAAEFHIFGRGDLDTVTTSLPANVTAHGFVSQEALGTFLGKNAVGVNPRPRGVHSNTYNAPYKLITYLSRGMPVITTRTAGLPVDLASVCNVVDDAPRDLAKTVVDLYGWSSEQLARAGTRGRDLIRETRSPAALARLLESLFE